MAGGVDEAQVLEAADDVDASASVLARRRLAFVDVDGTSVASESTALADGSRATFFADAAIFARIGIAVAAVLAAFAAQPGRALATVVVVEVVAAAVEETRRRSAWIAVDLAAGAHETRPASALIAGQNADHFRTGTAVHTGLSAANSGSFERNAADEFHVGEPLQRDGLTGRIGIEAVQRGSGRIAGQVLREEIVVEPDLVQATDKAHADVIQGPNFGTEEDRRRRSH